MTHIHWVARGTGTPKDRDEVKASALTKLADLLHTAHKVKTVQVGKNRGRHCGDIELYVYLTNETVPLPFVLDLLIDHDRFGSSSDPSLNGH